MVSPVFPAGLTFSIEECMAVMIKFLTGQMLGCFSLIVVMVNTTFWGLLLFLVALIKLSIPIRGWQLWCGRLSHAIGQQWVGINNLGLRLTKQIHWEVEGLEGLTPDGWYLVLANHQSMVDITVLQKVFHGKVPMLKFFLKKELIWVPILGMAWWALDFPFMRRSSSVQKDFETALQACEKFRLMPVAVMNFVEGTRFTEAKRLKQNSPFKHLLKPKAGGTAIVLGAMGEQLQAILDVTIVYPEGVKEMWKFLCSRSIRVRVLVRQLPVRPEIVGDYLVDREFRKRFNLWLNSLWQEKDELIERML